MRVMSVVGARPNFMKMAPVVRALKRSAGVESLLVHTGQHYDEELSEVFFRQLGMPEPDASLAVGSGTHAEQTGRLLTALERSCIELGPDLVLVGGDVNSTMAAALAAAKLKIPVGHVEAGLRSFDRSMPEEVNRVVADHLSELLFTTEESGSRNLRREGVAEERIFFVGNCMVDTLLEHIEHALAQEPWSERQLDPGGYLLATLHRPANVDDPTVLRGLVDALNEASRMLPVVLPLHPRTRKRLEEGAISMSRGVRLEPPLPYLSFLGLMARARCVLTDSGGIQEETTALGVPCLTLRRNTERPITVELGTNKVIGNEPDQIVEALQEALADERKAGSQLPPLWDGKAGVRVAEIVAEWGGQNRTIGTKVSGRFPNHRHAFPRHL
ncbi:MAG TPA: UDP-N-acetylglucosamine 2-epimerase (non-hydrolyzing) [Thermoanaerobaculia bacterium]|nr:UDP-N-acetylglucosamine 2-epimerase (non-hydrolyzing) [Thermoanaerobaculia bacterium]